MSIKMSVRAKALCNVCTCLRECVFVCDRIVGLETEVFFGRDSSGFSTPLSSTGNGEAFVERTSVISRGRHLR